MDVDRVSPAERSTDEQPRRALALVADGLMRVASAPAVLLGAWALTVIAALPPAILLHQAIAGDLGASMAAQPAADGVNWEWWQEFAVRHRGWAGTFRPSIIGFAAALRNASDLLDGRWPGPLAAVVGVYLLGWTFLLGGALDRYARRRPIGGAAFFAASGVFFWRFLRLGALAVLAYAFLFVVVHAWLFDDVFGRIVRDLTSERAAFAWRVVLYAVFLVLLAGVTLIFDYARVRAVVEDRRSMIGALAAGARFVRRNMAAAFVVFAINSVLLAAVAAAYALASPAAAAPLWVALLTGQLYLAGRLGVRLTFYASAVALLQDRVAHAGYTAAPPHRWPDAPAVEAVTNAPPRGA